MLQRTESKYDVCFYDGCPDSEVTIKRMTDQEVKQFNPQDYDLYISVPDGVLAYKKEGNWVEYKNEWPIGKICYDILECLALEPGIYFSPADLSVICSNDYLREHSNLAVKICTLRKSLPGFIETTKVPTYSVRFAKRSFLWIQRVPFTKNSDNN